MRKLGMLAVLFGFVVLVFGPGAKVSALPLALPVNGVHFLLGQSTSDPVLVSCDVLNSTPGSISVRCCPPPGAAGSCVILNQPQPREYDAPPPTSCTVYLDPQTGYWEQLTLSCNNEF